MKKSIFDWTVKEVREFQVKHLTGSFQTWVEFAPKLIEFCDLLKEKDLDDKFLRALNEPLGFWFIVNISKTADIYVVGKNEEYSFWKVKKGEMPTPIASTHGEMGWCDEIYEISGVQLPNQTGNSNGEVLKVYERGYFTI